MDAMGTPWQAEVDGGTLHGLRWGAGDRIAVALHGITANAMSWRAVARHLVEQSPEWSIVALDQRGRGRSRELPGPYALEDLARDAAEVARVLGAEVIAGHSMGAYVALGVDHLHPAIVERLVLVDGGLMIPVPAGVDADALLDAVVGPMIARLTTTYPDIDAYVGFFREHPAMGPFWSDDFDAYARYDAVPIAGGVTARAVVEAVHASGRELLERAEEIEAAVSSLSVPATLFRAARGMLNDPAPFLPDAVVEAQSRSTPLLTVEDLPDTNHYTVLVGDTAAQAVAAGISGR